MLKHLVRKASRHEALAVAAMGHFAGAAEAQETVTIGVLHSPSGTMAISETSLREVVLMAVDEINAKGGVNVGGKAYKIEPKVVDPASDWDKFTEKSKELVVNEKCVVTFGCWTS